MSGPVLRARHRDSPRTRRAARAAGVDLRTVRPTGPHGRATLADVGAAVADLAARPPIENQVTEHPAAASAVVGEPVVADPGPGSQEPTAPAAPPVAAVPASSSLVEVDVTALLRSTPGPGRSRLLGAAVGALARASSALRPPGLPEGPVTVRAVDDDGAAHEVPGADLLSADGLGARLLAGPDRAGVSSDPPPGASGAAVEVVGTGTAGTTVEVRPLGPGGLAVLTVGPVVRRPVVVLGVDGGEQLGIRSVVWLALTAADPATASALLARVGRELAGATAAAR